jgi:hypothetical protein
MNLAKYDWKHAALEISSIGAVVAEALAQAAQSGTALPLHVTAGGLVALAMVFGHISADLSGGGPVPGSGK